MNKILKILPLLFVFIFLANISVVCASGIDMDLEANQASDSTVYGSSQNTDSTTNNTATNNTTTNQSARTQIPVGTTAALSSSNLELPTIINIILIAIGILLILLGIAILIRLH